MCSVATGFTARILPFSQMDNNPVGNVDVFDIFLYVLTFSYLEKRWWLVFFIWFVDISMH